MAHACGNFDFLNNWLFCLHLYTVCKYFSDMKAWVSEMVYSFNDIKCKEVIDIKTGARLGFPDDLEFDNCTAKICRLIIFGRARFFGIFGREDDIDIRWGDIEVIGEDTILVSCELPPHCSKKRGKSFGNIFK